MTASHNSAARTRLNRKETSGDGVAPESGLIPPDRFSPSAAQSGAVRKASISAANSA
jgi:hypothetical protein